MDNDELLKDVDVSDIPETYQPVVSLIGLDNFLKLCRYAMGDELYFPMQVFYGIQESGLSFGNIIEVTYQSFLINMI